MGEIRLVNGSAENEGTVEICYHDLWGLISDSGWDDSDAEVVCRQLGYSTTSTYSVNIKAHSKISPRLFVKAELSAINFLRPIVTKKFVDHFVTTLLQPCNNLVCMHYDLYVVEAEPKQKFIITNIPLINVL